LPPQKPIVDVRNVTGKWVGPVTLVQPSTDSRATQAAGTHHATLTINENGTWENVIPTLTPGRFSGVFTVKDGVLRWRSHTTGAVGTYTLHESDGRRVLVISTDRATATGVLTPAK
jgi:hypothetical protein